MATLTQAFPNSDREKYDNTTTISKAPNTRKISGLKLFQTLILDKNNLQIHNIEIYCHNWVCAIFGEPVLCVGCTNYLFLYVLLKIFTWGYQQKEI